MVRHPLPVAVIFGLLHVVMPLITLGLGTLCFPDAPLFTIGLVLEYAVPTGVASLMWVGMSRGNTALCLSVVLLECKQMGTALTVEQGVRFLESHILPHQNRSILKNRADEIAMQFQSVLAKNNRQGIRTQAEKKEVASAWLELAISCAKVPVKYEADEIKRRQKEEKTQRETEPVMA